MDLSCSVAPFFPLFFLVAAPPNWSSPKRVPLFSRVTEQLRDGFFSFGHSISGGFLKPLSGCCCFYLGVFRMLLFLGVSGMRRVGGFPNRMQNHRLGWMGFLGVVPSHSLLRTSKLLQELCVHATCADFPGQPQSRKGFCVCLVRTENLAPNAGTRSIIERWSLQKWVKPH